MLILTIEGRFRMMDNGEACRVPLDVLGLLTNEYAFGRRFRSF